MLANKEYLVKDINSAILVERVTRKEILSYIDEFTENAGQSWFNSDDTFEVLYKDGTVECISQEDYDGHKIKRSNIVSMVYSNESSYMVYGNYSVNCYGVVNTCATMDVDKTNIIEI
uniref:Uncharacterized protein n=1 Tax=Dulem virus 36 TaxID=3145754 RepID=A0AAU8B012_9CAUD